MEKFKGLKRYNDIVTENANNEGDVTPEEAKNAEKRLSYEMVTREVKIPESNKKTYDKVIKNVKKYCKTIGFPEPTEKNLGTVYEFHLVGEGVGVTRKTFDFSEMEEILNNDFIKTGNNTYIPKKGGKNFAVVKVPYEKIELTIVDEVKPLEEWVILGTIDFKDGILNPAPGKQIPNELIPEKLYGKSYCAHCNSTRMRNKIVFIKNEDNGEIIQVGGSCIKYYLGYDYERVLKLIESISNLYQTEEVDEDYYDGYWAGGFKETDYSAKEIIKYYIWHVKEHNTHVSKKTAEMHNENLPEGKIRKKSTGEAVKDEIIYVNNQPEKGFREDSYDFNKRMEEWEKNVKEFNKNVSSISDKEYKEIVDFVESKTQESNFMFNVSNKIKEAIIKEKFISYICGACSYFFSVKISEEERGKKQSDKEKELAGKRASSNHIGTVGEKIACENLTIKKIRGFETQFGWSNVYNMEDEQGNVFVKFGTINKKFLVKGQAIEEGAVLSFTADVKKHDEFNGVKQTTLGRLSKFNPDLKY
jgi:hypothetical protein